ncbi:hypothetical protein AXF42_Ash011835 [Apostasia shenzhenica]|uniref:U1-type domain-containing protein n=1 Tax=Apostasia shenzhenica TaxID=1088818 RepID=A0A2I0AVZ7_9ASPA|nr:hypothetical protein AXF42_Ash011835 [Apostasia shenzhenica]
MIKRQFYKQDHGDNSGSSDSSSSEDPDSAPEVEAEEEIKLDEQEDEEEEQQQESGLDKRTMRYPSPGSGYEREDSSSNPDDNDASDLISKAEVDDEKGFHHGKDSKSIGKFHDKKDEASAAAAITLDPNDPIQSEFSKFILKFKSVFKCRLCPRILCLNETAVRTHLTSKRHARSKKLLGEGRLKLMLNSDGELEEEQETHAERHARILELAQCQKPAAPNKKDNGRQRQSRRRKKRMRSGSKKEKLEASVGKTAKKRRKMAG